MKRPLLFFASLAIVLPASASLLFDLTVDGGLFGSGHIGFDATSITEFEFTVESIDPLSPNSAPLPFTFGAADVEAADWYVNNGVLAYLELDTFTLIGANPDHQYDLTLSFQRRTAQRKKTPAPELPDSWGDININELDSLGCGFPVKMKRPVLPLTPTGAGYFEFCSSTIDPDPDRGRRVAVSVGSLSSPVSVPEPPVLVLMAIGLLMVRFVGRKIRR
ncbi:MAG: hypothetical protein ACI87W_001906 [Halieaceae bacterium]|jgi:hypothetical protein